MHVDDTLQKDNSTDEETFTLTIKAENSQSKFISTPVEGVKVGEEYSYKIEVEDADSELSVKITGATPSWLKVKKINNTYFLKGTPVSKDIGRENKVTLITHDKVPQVFKIDIYESPVVNPVTVENIQAKNEKGSIKLANFVENFDESELSFIIQTLPTKGVLKIGENEVTTIPHKFPAKSESLMYQRTGYGEDYFQFKAYQTVNENNQSNVANVVIKYKDLQPIMTLDSRLNNVLEFAEDGNEKKYEISVKDVDSAEKIQTPNVKSELADIIFAPDNTSDNTSDNTKTFTMSIKPKTNQFGNERITIIAKSGDEKDEKSFEIKITPKHIKFREISTQINVCWKQITHDSIIIPATSPLVDDVKKLLIKETIDNSWGNKTAIKFQWYEEEYCPDEKNPLKISFVNDWISKELKQKALYVPESHAIVFDTSIEYKRTIIHEFGHALGFPDEHARLDVYRADSGKQEQENSNKVCRHIVNGVPILSGNHTYQGAARGALGLKVVTMADWQQQPYNPLSVMNDCTSAENYKDKFIDEAKKIFLSDDDIKRAQQFYGAPLVANQTKHLMKDGNQFVTGLRKKDMDMDIGYDFYEYGVKNDTYNNGKVINTKKYKNDDYFYISKIKQNPNNSNNPNNPNNPNNLILFKYLKDQQILTPVKNSLMSCRQNQNVADDRRNHFDGCMEPQVEMSNYNIYYHDFYGRKNEFSIKLCKNIEDTNMDGYANYHQFANIDEDACYDLNVFFNEYRFDDFFTGNVIFTRSFIKGKGMSGLVSQDVDTHSQDGQFINPADYLEFSEKVHIYYRGEKSLLTGSITKELPKVLNFVQNPLENPVIAKFEKLKGIKSGYYVKGVHVDETQVTYRFDPINWELKNNKSSNYINIKQKNIYAFVTNEAKLYKNGELYTGEFTKDGETKQYLNGIPK